MKLKITVNDVAYEVDVEILDSADGVGAPEALPTPQSFASPGAAYTPLSPAAASPALAPPAQAGALASPVAGTVLEVRCKPGDVVDENQLVFVLETMKMKTSIAAPGKGRVSAVLVAVGDSVREGQPLLSFA